MKNYEIMAFVDVRTGRRTYFWRHLPNTKQISIKQAKFLNEKVAYLNEVAKYE